MINAGASGRSSSQVLRRVKRSLRRGESKITPNTTQINSIHTFSSSPYHKIDDSINTDTVSTKSTTQSLELPSLPKSWDDPFPSYHHMYPCQRLLVDNAPMVVISTEVLQQELDTCMQLVEKYLDHLIDPFKTPSPPTYSSYPSQYTPEEKLNTIMPPSEDTAIFFDYNHISETPIPISHLPHFAPQSSPYDPTNPSLQPCELENPYANNFNFTRPSLRALSVSTFLSAPILSLASLQLTPLSLIHSAGFSHEHIPILYKKLAPLLGHSYYDSDGVYIMDRIRIASKDNPDGLAAILTALNISKSDISSMMNEIKKMGAHYTKIKEMKLDSVRTTLQRIISQRLHDKGVKLAVFVTENGVSNKWGVNGEVDLAEEGVDAEHAVLDMFHDYQQSTSPQLEEESDVYIEGLNDLSHTAKIEIAAGLWVSPLYQGKLYQHNPALEPYITTSTNTITDTASLSNEERINRLNIVLNKPERVTPGWSMSSEHQHFLRQVVNAVEVGWIDNQLIGDIINSSTDGAIYACEIIDCRKGVGVMKGKKETKLARRKAGEGGIREDDEDISPEKAAARERHEMRMRMNVNPAFKSVMGGMMPGDELSNTTYSDKIIHDTMNPTQSDTTPIEEDDVVERDDEVDHESDSEIDSDIESEDEDGVGDLEDSIIVTHERDMSGDISGIHEFIKPDKRFERYARNDIFFNDIVNRKPVNLFDVTRKTNIHPIPNCSTLSEMSSADRPSYDFGPLIEVDFVQGLGRQKRLLGNFNPKSPLIQSVLGSRNARNAKPNFDYNHSVETRSKNDDVESLAFWERLDYEDEQKTLTGVKGFRDRQLVTELVPSHILIEKEKEKEQRKLERLQKKEKDMKEMKQKRQDRLKQKMGRMAKNQGDFHLEGLEDVDEEDESVETTEVVSDEGKLVVDPETGEVKRLLRVLDVTGGFGTDSFMVASSIRHNNDVELEMTLIERNPVMFLLLSDGIRRAQQADIGTDLGKLYSTPDDNDFVVNTEADDEDAFEVDQDGNLTAKALKAKKSQTENITAVLGDVEDNAVPKFFSSTTSKTVIHNFPQQSAKSISNRKSTGDVMTDILTTPLRKPSLYVDNKSSLSLDDSEDKQKIVELAEKTLFKYIKTGMGEDTEEKLRSITGKSKFAHTSRVSDLHQRDVALIARRMKVMHSDSIDYLARNGTKLAPSSSKSSGMDVLNDAMVKPRNNLLKSFNNYIADTLSPDTENSQVDFSLEIDDNTPVLSSPIQPYNKYNRYHFDANCSISPFSQPALLSLIYQNQLIQPLGPNNRQFDVIYMDPFYPAKQSGKYAKDKKMLRNTKLMAFAKILRDIDEQFLMNRSGVAVDSRYGHKSDNTYTLTDGNDKTVLRESKDHSESLDVDSTPTEDIDSTIESNISESSETKKEKKSKKTAFNISVKGIDGQDILPLHSSAELAHMLNVCRHFLHVNSNSKINKKTLRQLFNPNTMPHMASLYHLLPLAFKIENNTSDGIERTTSLRCLPFQPPPPTYRSEPFNTELMCLFARLASLVRVVVKRPKYAPVLFRDDTHTFKDRKTRFDVVVPVNGKTLAKRMLTATMNRMLGLDEVKPLETPIKTPIKTSKPTNEKKKGKKEKK